VAEIEYNESMTHTLVLQPKLSADPFVPEIWLLELSSETDTGLVAVWPELCHLLEKTHIYLIISFHRQEQVSEKLIQTLLQFEGLACEPELRIFWCELTPTWTQFLQAHHLDHLFEIHSTRSKVTALIKTLWEEDKQLFGEMPTS
jgi:hypothetical protein